MNWANRITLSRLALTVLFVVALNSSWQYARTAALVIFLIAGLTDLIDGEIARRYGLITNFGKLMDPLVDKIMVAAAFISLVPLKAVPAWAATTVVARDFLITGLRLMATAKGRILPAESLGKQKTSWQMITIIFFLALLSIVELRYANETSTWWARAWSEAGPVLVWITVALTVYSGLGFTWRNRELIAISPGEAQTGVNRQRHRNPHQHGTGFAPGPRPPCRCFIGVAQFYNRKERQKENNRNHLPRSFLFAETFRRKNPAFGGGHQAQACNEKISGHNCRGRPCRHGF